MLDAASNRRQTTILGTMQTYALDASMQTRDLAANQYTFVGNTARSHDLMGNLVGSSDTGRQAFYDADNRLVQWTEGSKDIRYRYDVDGRRTVKEDVGTASFPRTVYFWDGWQTVEETNSAGTLVRQYVWGEGIDECLKASIPDKASDLDDDLDTSDDWVDLYYHHNSLGSVVAVTNGAGTVVESYRYSAFGKPTIYGQHPSDPQGQGSEIAATYVEQPFMFTGARYDFEEGSGLYQMRHRFYDPVVGRFVSRDPLGLWGDPSQNGNGQGYCAHNPVNGLDPMGLGDGSPDPGDPIVDDRNYRTHDEWSGLSKSDRESFANGFMDQYGDRIRDAAKKAGIPAWLLASVIMGERIDITTGEPFCEYWGGWLSNTFGLFQSVGLAQLRVDVAIKRGLTESAKAYADSHDGVETTGTGQEWEDWRDEIRYELLDDDANIKASAEYVKQLLADAAAAASRGEDVSKQFGNFDWKAYAKDGDVEKLAASAFGGGKPDRDAHAGLAGFIGAAHNDNRVTGDYNLGYGLSQGGNAISAAETLWNTGVR